MTILVTTPRGKVGRELVPLLRERGLTIRLAAHSVDETRVEFPGLEVVRLDYSDASTFAAAVQGVSDVYLAAPSDLPQEGERRFIDGAKAAGVSKIVKLSAASAATSTTPSALRDLERHIEASGLRWTHLRPTWFDQNYSTSQVAAIRSGTFAEPAGTGKTAFIDTRDVAAVAAEVLTSARHDGKAYLLTGPEPLDRHEVADILTREIGRTVHYVTISDEHFRESVKKFLTPAYVELLSVLYADVRAGATATVTKGVEEILGRPPIAFVEFVRRNRAIWR